MYVCVQPSSLVPVHTSAYAQRVTAINISSTKHEFALARVQI